MIEDWIRSYNPQSKLELLNAKREIIQEVALSGLHRGSFFEHACFYGGTALRIFYGLDRYSEDLDFSLLEKDKNFSLAPYISFIEDEFKLIGMDAVVTIKEKKSFSAVQSAFLKDDTEWSDLNIEFDRNNKYPAKLKVKIEVDRDPPLDFETESKLLIKPSGKYINCMIKEHLFAGKMHAVMFREWKNNEKGRDWYDMIWYITKGIEIGLSHFNRRANESGNLIDGKDYTKNSFIETLHKKIDTLDVEMALQDIKRFVASQQSIEMWSRQFFHDIIDHIKFKP